MITIKKPTKEEMEKLSLKLKKMKEERDKKVETRKTSTKRNIFNQKLNTKDNGK